MAEMTQEVGLETTGQYAIYPLYVFKFTQQVVRTQVSLGIQQWLPQMLTNTPTYYTGTNFSGDHFRHADGHSKILGYCFDGYPFTVLLHIPDYNDPSW